MTLSILQDAVKTWTDHNFPNAQPWEPLLGVAEEVGELCHAHLKLHQGIRGTEEKHMAAKEDAIGDILIYMAHYCNLNEIDLTTSVERAWDVVSQRDWKANPTNANTCNEPKSQ